MIEQEQLHWSNQARPMQAPDRTRPRMTLALVLYMWICGVTGLALVCVFWPSPFLLAGLLAVDAALMLSVRRSAADVVLLAFCGAFGAVAESFGIATGAWTYTVPLAAGVPIWLPFIWGIAALFVKEISLQIQFVTGQM